MLLYLNRTGYNGLFRLNQRRLQRAGRALRPAADRARRAAAGRLGGARRRRGVSIALRAVRRGGRRRPAPGAFVYFDPPYAPLGRDRQLPPLHRPRLLGRRPGAAAGPGRRRWPAAACTSCSATRAPTSIERLYKGRTAASAGLRLRRVPARRAINTRADRRGYVDEVVVSNLPPGRPEGRVQGSTPWRDRAATSPASDGGHAASVERVRRTVRAEHSASRYTSTSTSLCLRSQQSARDDQDMVRRRPGRSRRAEPCYSGKSDDLAKVAELADAPDLGSGSRKAMGVRVPPFAPAFARQRELRRRRGSAGAA